MFALLIFRLFLGLLIASHGAQKLFGWFGGHGLKGTEGFLASMGLPRPDLQAKLSGTTEFAGGLLLALGFLTPFAAAAIMGAMLAAIFTVHVKNGFFNSEGGMEFPLLVFFSAWFISYTGAGPHSLDTAFGWWLHGNGWAGLALLLAVVASAGVLLSRKTPPAQE